MGYVRFFPATRGEVLQWLLLQKASLQTDRYHLRNDFLRVFSRPRSPSRTVIVTQLIMSTFTGVGVRGRIRRTVLTVPACVATKYTDMFRL